MKVSVVMSTYNGAAYIEEQLTSLLYQTMQPDEVIILDDCSEDNTMDLIESFIGKFSLSHWTVIQNKKNVGWELNFANGIERCRGEIIFTCDQDDIWMEDKIESMVTILQLYPSIMLLAGGYIEFIQNRNGSFYEDTVCASTGCIEKQPFDEKFFYVQRPGCTYGFRRQLWDIAKTYNFRNNPHDALLWRTACALDGLYVFCKPVIYWRRHTDAATYGKKFSKEEMLKWCDYTGDVLTGIRHALQDNDAINKQGKLEKLLCFEKMIQWRQKAYKTMNPIYQMVSWRYYKYYLPRRSILGEMLRILQMGLTYRLDAIRNMREQR